MRACARCGQEFSAVPSGGKAGRPRTQCNSCRTKSGSNIRPYKPRYSGCCYECGLDFIGQANQKFCSSACRNRWHHERENFLRAQGRSCRKCQVLLVKMGQRLPHVCQECSARTERERLARKNHSRRTTGKMPSKAQVLERWGNRCHLCGKKIDLRLSGKDRAGFTFDHVIPVSKGGTNDPENIRPAHFACNIARGNRGPVQLDLGMCG